MNEIEIDHWMRRFAALDEREHILPDPSVIWLKAQVLQSAKAMERATGPITAVQITAYAIIAGCWAALLTWKWAALQAWVNSMTPAHIIRGAAGAQATASLSLTLLAMLVILASATVMVAMHTILAEE